MARLDSRKRADLPDSAFAYVDSRGRRRLPIHDEAHVKNALSRFNQVAFENDAARERTRKRLLNAAKKYGIVPVGFITGQLELERTRGNGARAEPLPSGFVTLMMTDVESSTVLLRRLGDRYGEVLNDIRAVLRQATTRCGGREIDARADEFFAVFEIATGALRAAVSIQRELVSQGWPDGLEVRVRIGIHSGHPTVADGAYLGLPVHTVARVSSAAHGGQILISEPTWASLDPDSPEGVRFTSLGQHRLAGLADAESLFQVEAEGLRSDFPPPRTAGK